MVTEAEAFRAAIAINDERFAAGMCAPQRKTPDREKNVFLLIQIKAIPRTSRWTLFKNSPLEADKKKVKGGQHGDDVIDE